MCLTDHCPRSVFDEKFSDLMSDIDPKIYQKIVKRYTTQQNGQYVIDYDRSIKMIKAVSRQIQRTVKLSKKNLEALNGKKLLFETSKEKSRVTKSIIGLDNESRRTLDPYQAETNTRYTKSALG